MLVLYQRNRPNDDFAVRIVRQSYAAIISGSKFVTKYMQMLNTISYDYMVLVWYGLYVCYVFTLYV